VFPHDVRGERRVALVVRRQHLGIHGLDLRRGAILVVVVVVICAAVKVGRSLVLVGPAVISVAIEDGTHFVGRVLKELLVVTKNDDGNLYIAEHGKLMRLLEETALAFQKGDGAIPVILDGLDFDLSASHLGCGRL
jgi:hypothetical protein